MVEHNDNEELTNTGTQSLHDNLTKSGEPGSIITDVNVKKREFVSRIRPPSRANVINSFDLEKLKLRSMERNKSYVAEEEEEEEGSKKKLGGGVEGKRGIRPSPITKKDRGGVEVLRSNRSISKSRVNPTITPRIPISKPNLTRTTPNLTTRTPLISSSTTTTRSPKKINTRVPLASRFNKSPHKSSETNRKRGVHSTTSGRSSIVEEEEEEGEGVRSGGSSEWGVSPPMKKVKRSENDYKGRLEDNEKFTKLLHKEIISSSESIKLLNEKLSSSQFKITKLEESRCDLETTISTKEQVIKEKEFKIIGLETSLETISRQTEERIRSLNLNHELEMATLNSRLGILTREKEMLDSELKNLTRQYQDKLEENTKLSKTISDQTSNYLTLESENRHLKTTIEITTREKEERDTKIDSLLKELESKNQLVTELEAKIREEESIRRQLHNTVQELKGNIRVFCRVRPPIGSEKTMSGILSHLNFPEKDRDHKSIELKQIKESSLSKVHKTHPFTFDRVFPPTSSQREVFDEISQLVQSALDGYPVCIFAYGQTGSGKTFTMEGPNNPNPDTEGMIPRAVAQIFETAETLKEKGWQYSMVCQFVEIYNETLNDLLSNGEPKKFEIRHESTGKTTVTDVVTVPVHSPHAVHSLLTKASRNRAVASTNCNERSSRSHSVFTMRLIGRNDLTSERSEGVLNLIDLAGSESLTKSGSAGDRLRETQAINRSLSCLSDVIHALSNQSAHVPYRNSKLTYLLQNSLGGNSKTLMFVNVSPLSENAQETLFSLQFATKVNACQIGTAKKTVR